MPGMDGVQVCREIRQGDQDQSYTYVILLTGRGRKEDILFGMDAGADDYITKPFDADELKVRLRAAQRILDLQAELIAAREALRHQAMHDSLTGLWNRLAILERFQQELARARRDGAPIAVLMADVDNFKRINDTYGHKAGDAVLCEIARRMKQAVRSYDSVGRYGGEEFLILLPNCDLANAAQQAQRLRACIADGGFHVAARVLQLTASFGVAVSGPNSDADLIIQAADAALYRAKAAGRNCVQVSADLLPAGFDAPGT